MNFTSYEAGFGAAANGPNASGAGIGKSSRLLQNEFGGIAGSTTAGQSNSRNGGPLITNSTNSLIKSHQQIGGNGMGNNNIYNNINTQSSSLGIKSSINTAGSA